MIAELVDVNSEIDFDMFLDAITSKLVIKKHQMVLEKYLIYLMMINLKVLISIILKELQEN